MEGSPWWFTPLMTFAGIVVGGAVSIITAWLTQRYNLQTQLAVKRAEFDSNAEAARRTEKENRYLAIVRGIESLYEGSPNASRKSEFLKVVREVGLLGDQELVRKLRIFMDDIAGKCEGDSRERLFGDVMLEMRRGLDIPTDRLSNQDFRLLSA